MHCFNRNELELKEIRTPKPILKAHFFAPAQIDRAEELEQFIVDACRAFKFKLHGVTAGQFELSALLGQVLSIAFNCFTLL